MNRKLAVNWLTHNNEGANCILMGLEMLTEIYGYTPREAVEGVKSICDIFYETCNTHDFGSAQKEE